MRSPSLTAVVGRSVARPDRNPRDFLRTRKHVRINLQMGPCIEVDQTVQIQTPGTCLKQWQVRGNCELEVGLFDDGGRHAAKLNAGRTMCSSKGPSGSVTMATRSRPRSRRLISYTESSPKVP